METSTSFKMFFWLTVGAGNLQKKLLKNLAELRMFEWQGRKNYRKKGHQLYVKHLKTMGLHFDKRFDCCVS